ncbi:MAG: iron-regulated protein [Bacteroidetes bacterium]|nr:iron-regulated protein [Bacteroidota bacterium]
MSRFFQVIAFSIFFLFSSFAVAPQIETHHWYTGKGKILSWEKVLQELENADMIFFGESHNDPHAHWYEKKLAQYLIDKKGKNLVMGCEMLEADNQLVVNEYLSGIINYTKLEENARLWNNHKTDYQPIIDLAKENGIPVIATNIPRRYAAMVYSNGFDALNSLEPEAKSFFAPLPIQYDTAVACYNKLLHMDMMGHGSPNFPKSQAAKDATMAHFILKNWTPGKVFYHWNGSYHSNNHEGIVWYLKQANPNLKIYVISNSSEDDIDKLSKESEDKGDAILITDSSFPTSY